MPTIEQKLETTEHTIGSTTYLVTYTFKENTTEDAFTKMRKIVQNEARRTRRDCTDEIK